MRLSIFAAAVLATASASAADFEVFKSYTPSTEVWNVTFVKVNPNRVDDYLAGLKQTWWDSCQLQIKQGTVLECSVFASETFANSDFNLMLVTKVPSAAISDPNEKRYNDFIAAQRKMLAEDKQDKIVEGYDELRTFFGEQNFRRLTFK